MPTDIGKIIGGGGLVALGFIPGLQLLQPIGISVGLSGLAGLIRGSPRPGRKNLGGRQQAQLVSNHTTPGAPIPVVYGAVKLGVLVNDYRVDTSIPKDLYIPAVLSHGSRDSLGIASVDEIYFDDRLAFDPGGTVQAPFTSGTAAVTKILGTTTQNWGTTVVGAKSLNDVKAADWSSTTDKGAGLAGFILKLTFDTDIYATGVPVVTAQLKGNLVEDTRSKVSGVDITFADANPDTITRASGSFVTDGYVANDRVDVSGSASNDGKYTIATVAATVLTLIAADTLVAEGPSGGITLKRWAHPDNGADNPAMCVRDYLLSTIYGPGLAEADLDEASFETIANYCDDSIVAVPVTQKRYTCNGWVDVSRSIATVLTELLSSFRGNLVYEGGVFRLFSTRSVTPSTIALTKDNIVGDWQFTNAGAAQKFNVARATFIDPTRNFMPELAQWPNAGATNTFLTDDNNWENRLEIDLPFTNDIYRAEQTMMTLLKESRQGIAATVTCTEEALQLQIGDVAPVTHETPGWTAKNFWVMGMALLPDTRVRLALLEYDATSYSLDTQSTDPGEPDTDLPNPFTVAAPTGLTLSAQAGDALATGDGGYIGRIRMTWTAPAFTFIDHYDIQAKHTAVADYDAWGPAPGDATEFFIGPADPVSWDVRIRAVNTLGVKSAFASASVTPDLPPSATAASITDGWSAAQNTAAPENGDVVIKLTTDVAYSNLEDANGVPTAYDVPFDLDGTGMASGNVVFVHIDVNNGPASASWTEVWSLGFSEFVNGLITARFITSQDKDWDLRARLTYSTAPAVGEEAIVTMHGEDHANPGVQYEKLTPTPSAVTGGGTGANTLTDKNLLIGKGFDPVEFLAPGAAGVFARSDGSDWQSAAPTAADIDPGTFPLGDYTYQGNCDVNGQVRSVQTAVAASAIDWDDSNSQTISNTGARTITMSNQKNGGVYVLRILRAASAVSSWTWPSTVKWVGGTPPALSTAANRVDIITFYYDGTRFLGVFNLGFNV